MKDKFTLSVEFGETGCAHMLFSDDSKKKFVDFVDDPWHRIDDDPCPQYSVIGWFVDIGITLLKSKGVGFKCSLYTEYSTIPSFIDFEAIVNLDGNMELKVEEVPSHDSIVFVTSINNYVEQVLKLFDDNMHKFSVNKRTLMEYYTQEGKLEKLRNLFHSQSEIFG